MTDMTEVFDTRRAVPLTVAEREFNIPTSTLRRWCRNGTLRSYKRAGVWRVMPEHVAELLVFAAPRRRR
jgi:predicted site-specific integrase-resolvase